VTDHKHAIDKAYFVLVEGIPSQTQLEHLSKGVDLKVIHFAHLTTNLF